MAKPIRDTSEALNWEILPCAAYSADLALLDYLLFASMSHALAEQCFGSYEDVKKWLNEWFTSKGCGIHKFPEIWEKYMTSDGACFE